MRKIESGSIRMSKPFGAVAPSLKPSVPLFYGGCTVLSIHPSTSVLSEQALAALKYAFLQNKKVGITGAKVESLKPPCNSDLAKAEAAYSIARELVEWSERFAIDDDEAFQTSRGCLETQDDHKMSDKAPDSVYSIDAKDEKDVFGARMFGDVKDPEFKGPEVKDPEVKLERFDEFKDIESRPLPYFEGNLDLYIKSEPASSTEKSHASTAVRADAVVRADIPETPNFLKDTGCDGFDFFKSDRDYNTEYSALSLLSYSTSEPMSSLDDLTQHTVDIDLAFPVPPLPVYSKMDSDRFDDLYSSIESPQSPFLLSPFSTSPHSPLPSSFPDS